MKRLLLLLFSFCLLPALWAAPFLGPSPLDLPALLPPPPADGSPTARVELDQVLALQETRTPEQAARCVQVENETIWLFGSEVMGPWFTEARLPKMAAFFAAVREDFITANRAAKALYPRKRPPFADERIKPCVEFHDTPSYPSGHGIQSSVWAGLLGEIFPAKANDFLLRAATTRNYKTISGVHYPSDLAAGQAVGEALARVLLKNPEVQKAIAEIRLELAHPEPKERPRLSSVSLSKNLPLSNRKPVQNIGVTGMDARWSDYGEYVTELIEIVQAQWHVLLKQSPATVPGGSSAVITFRLNSKGETGIVKVEDHGAGQDGVASCRNAITLPQPYRAWTAPMIAVLGQSQDLTFSFHYG
jgi:acid phosphatase (class A)